MSDNPQIMIPSFCHRHQSELVEALGLAPDDRWMSRMVVAQILMFQNATNQSEVWVRTKGDAYQLSSVLEEIGCLACFDIIAWGNCLKVMKKGFAHAAKVSKGEIDDPDWPVQLHKRMAEQARQDDDRPPSDPPPHDERSGGDGG